VIDPSAHSAQMSGLAIQLTSMAYPSPIQAGAGRNDGWSWRQENGYQTVRDAVVACPSFARSPGLEVVSTPPERRRDLTFRAVLRDRRLRQVKVILIEIAQIDILQRE